MGLLIGRIGELDHTNPGYHAIILKSSPFLGTEAPVVANLAQRAIGEEDFEIHWGSIFPTSSIGVTRPASASAIPRSIAARISSSSCFVRSTGGFESSCILAIALPHFEFSPKVTQDLVVAKSALLYAEELPVRCGVRLDPGTLLLRVPIPG